MHVFWTDSVYFGQTYEYISGQHACVTVSCTSAGYIKKDNVERHFRKWFSILESTTII